MHDDEFKTMDDNTVGSCAVGIIPFVPPPIGGEAAQSPAESEPESESSVEGTGNGLNQAFYAFGSDVFSWCVLGSSCMMTFFLTVLCQPHQESPVALQCTQPNFCPHPCISTG